MKSPEFINRTKRITRKGAPVVIAVAFAALTSGCDRSNIADNLVDCNNGPKSNSITFFLNESQHTIIGGRTIYAPIPGVLQIVIPENRTRSIVAVIPDIKTLADARKTKDTDIFITKKDGLQEISFATSKGTIFTVSGQPSSRDSVSGTEVSLQATCSDK